MNPVEYTLLTQRLFAILTGLSFVGLSAILVFLDPYQNSLYIWAFLAVFLIFLTGIITLLAFVWFFTIRKEILSITQVNQVIYQSLISSAVVVFAVVMNQTQQLNIWTAILLIVCYLFYFLWANSE
jgi:hypothetical protein